MRLSNKFQLTLNINKRKVVKKYKINDDDGDPTVMKQHISMSIAVFRVVMSCGLVKGYLPTFWRNILPSSLD
jgi:hypothetical protein